MSFRINRVYTRSGDQGETGLVGGERVSKSSLRVAAYGELDELNSFLGLTKERLSPETAHLREVIEFLQQELFDLGSELATPPKDEYPQMLKVQASHVERLEKLCDHFSEGLDELKSFILPGGSDAAALFHIARTVCRRAERTVVQLREAGQADPSLMVSNVSLQYLNRLSDLLFILARHVLRVEGLAAPLWEKGGKPIPTCLQK